MIFWAISLTHFVCRRHHFLKAFYYNKEWFCIQIMSLSIMNRIYEIVLIVEENLIKFLHQKLTTPASFLFISAFLMKYSNFTTNKCEKCPSNIRRQDSNSRLSGHEPLPWTTRSDQFCLLCGDLRNYLTLIRSRVWKWYGVESDQVGRHNNNIVKWT